MLAKANPAVIATVRADGQPVSAATWYLLRGDRILSTQYTGEQYPDRDRPRVSAWIEIDRIHGWGSQKNNDQPDGRR